MKPYGGSRCSTTRASGAAWRRQDGPAVLVEAPLARLLALQAAGIAMRGRAARFDGFLADRCR
eukprot:7080530-Prymnesium_polylepis.1